MLEFLVEEMGFTGFAMEAPYFACQPINPYQDLTSILTFGILYLLSAILSGIWSRLFFQYKPWDYSFWVFFLELPNGWIFLFLLFQEKHLAWAFFLPRVIWDFYAIFGNVEYLILNREFWDNAKMKK